MMTVGESIKIRCASISLSEEGLILLQYQSGMEIGLDDVKEVEAALLKLTSGGDMYAIVYSGGDYINLTNEAQDFLAKDASIVSDNIMKASAVIIDSLPNRLLANFFMKMSRPRFDMKGFSTLELAKKWLIKMKSNNEKNSDS